jgi:hypothetical protein
MSKGTQGAQKAQVAAKKRTAAKSCTTCRKCNVELPSDPARREAALVTFGEGSGRGAEADAEYEAIASVMSNRVAKGGYGGKTLMKVVANKPQFDAYQGNQYNKAKNGNLDPAECKNLQRAVDAVNKVMDQGVPDQYKDLLNFRTAGSTRARPGGVTIGGNYFW